MGAGVTMFAHLARARGGAERAPPVGGAATGSRSTTADRTARVDVDDADRASMMMAFGRVLALDFRAGALVLFIP